VPAVLKERECQPCNISRCLSNSHESQDDDRNSMPNSQDDDIMMMCLSNSHESHEDDSMTNSLSTRFGLRIVEKCFENVFGNVGSDFQNPLGNLRLGA